MIPFAEKLSFLMRIASISNKELAAEISVDPSMISLMRTGKRRLSKNPVQVKKMASFFARRCSAAFQRQALSDMLGKVSINTRMPVDELAFCLERWLQGENDSDLVGTILQNIQPSPTQPPESDEPPAAPTSGNQSLFFYGEEGRREVMYRMMQEIQSMEEPSSVLMVVDDNLEWLLSDYPMTKKIQASLMDVMERGFTFHQIMPPLNYINRYAESLKFWLPIYATGQIKVYYYPRLRGNLYRHSIIVVPGRCVQYAASVGPGSTSDITMFSTDPKLVSAFVNQFREHISLCRPALNVHTDLDDYYPCISDVLSRPGDIIQMVSPLSTNTLPLELAERCMKETDSPIWKTAFQAIIDDRARFEEHLKQYPLIDMSRLATAEEVRAGRVYIGAEIPSNADHPRYTPQTYAFHLQNILNLMDQYENYSFLPRPIKDHPNYNLVVNEGGLALMIRMQQPPLMLELRRPEMVIACREHLMRKAEAVEYNGIHREKVRMELRALIQELGS